MNDKQRVVDRLLGERKHLWCPICKCFPDVIKEEYQEPIIETRKWDGDCYALTDTNLDDTEFMELCGICNTKLEDKSG